MKVKELIDQLKKVDKEKEVYFEDNHWGLKKVNKVTVYEYDHETPILLKD